MKKIRDKDATTLKILKSITDNGSQTTYIVGATSLSNKLVRELIKPTVIQGEVKFVDTQGRLTLQNTEKYVKALNTMLADLEDYIDEETLLDSKQSEDDETRKEAKEQIKQSINEYIENDDERSEYDNPTPYKTLINIDLPYTNKMLSNLAKGKIPKRLPERYNYPSMTFTNIFNPSLNDTVIIFNNPSLQRNINTTLLYDVIQHSAEKHLNVIFIEDKKNNCWKLSTLFNTNPINETKTKSIQKKV